MLLNSGLLIVLLLVIAAVSWLNMYNIHNDAHDLAYRTLPKVQYLAQMHIDMVDAANTQKKADLLLIVLTAFGLGGSGTLAYFLNRHISQPIRQLTGEAAAINGENLDVHLKIERGDEIGSLAHSFNGMVERLKDAHRKLEENYFDTQQGLAASVDALDPYTFDHSRRVSLYVVVLCAHFGLAAEDEETIRMAGILHDIGKNGISDSVLHKPGPLDDAEWEEMKKHPVYGFSILKKMAYLGAVRTIILYHHERYDGKGYPDGLRAESIPLASRILAVADAFDALTSQRPYRKSLAPDEAMREIRKHAGAQFDPLVVDAMTVSAPDLISIYLEECS